jgi:hypothetical protein
MSAIRARGFCSDEMVSCPCAGVHSHGRPACPHVNRRGDRGPFPLDTRSIMVFIERMIAMTTDIPSHPQRAQVRTNLPVEVDVTATGHSGCVVHSSAAVDPGRRRVARGPTLAAHTACVQRRLSVHFVRSLQIGFSRGTPLCRSRRRRHVAEPDAAARASSRAPSGGACRRCRHSSRTLSSIALRRRNPVRDVKRPRVNARQGTTRAFSAKEARIILDAPDEAHA